MCCWGSMQNEWSNAPGLNGAASAAKSVQKLQYRAHQTKSQSQCLSTEQTVHTKTVLSAKCTDCLWCECKRALWGTVQSERSSASDFNAKGAFKSELKCKRGPKWTAEEDVRSQWCSQCIQSQCAVLGAGGLCSGASCLSASSASSAFKAEHRAHSEGISFSGVNAESASYSMQSAEPLQQCSTLNQTASSRGPEKGRHPRSQCGPAHHPAMAGQQYTW